MKIINLTQNTPEWEAFRQDKIGCSDLAAIMGISPWKTALELFEDKILARKSIPNAAMKRGSSMEASVRDSVNFHCSNHYKPVVVQHDIFFWLIASLDGYDPNANPEVLEIKCPGIEAHNKARAGTIPDYYKPQVQGQMAVAGTHNLLYVSSDGTTEAHIIVQRDDKYIEKLLEAAEMFRDRLINFNPPEPTDRDVIEINDPGAKELASRYSAILEQIKSLEVEATLIKEELIEMCDGKISKTGDLKLSKVLKRGGIDYGKIEALKGINLEPYRKATTEYWKLSNGSKEV